MMAICAPSVNLLGNNFDRSGFIVQALSRLSIGSFTVLTPCIFKDQLNENNEVLPSTEWQKWSSSVSWGSFRQLASPLALRTSSCIKFLCESCFNFYFSISTWLNNSWILRPCSSTAMGEKNLEVGKYSLATTCYLHIPWHAQNTRQDFFFFKYIYFINKVWIFRIGFQMLILTKNLRKAFGFIASLSLFFFF